jgi:hypothetical protein
VSEVRSKIPAALQAALKELNKLSISQEKLKKEINAVQDELELEVTRHRNDSVQQHRGDLA